LLCILGLTSEVLSQEIIKTPLKSGETKRFAETDDAAVAIEVILKPVEVEVPVLAIPVEVRDVPVAVVIPPDENVQHASRATAP